MLLDHHLRGAITDTARVARELETAGFDGLYTAEAAHEPFFSLALAAEHTTHATLFTSIAIAFARSPMDLAQMADGLQRLSGGRFALGLGSQIRPHIENRYSMPWTAPIPRMREMVSAIKAIQHTWQDGAPLSFRGEHYQHTLMTPFFDPGPNPSGPPPVWVAGLGPRMTAAAAETADGLLVHPFHSERYFHESVVPTVEAGLKNTVRARGEFSLSATPIICTGRNDEEVERAVAGVNVLLGFYGSTPSYRVTLDAHGWGDLQTELNRLTKEGRWDVIPTLIDDEVRETIAVCGKPAEIGGLVATRYGSHVDRVGLSMPYETPIETLGLVVDGFRA
ncbi:MAG: TIGR03617 family F420-dependent LLM class oxidoreductase [Acidimicrobiia bacterium]